MTNERFFWNLAEDKKNIKNVDHIQNNVEWDEFEKTMSQPKMHLV